MFFHKDLKGSGLPPKNLCLTYDDGPGPDTLELGRYLYAEGICATFFVIGRHAKERGDVLTRLSAWGHQLGNHTYDHPGLVALAETGGDVVGELARTDLLLHAHMPKGPVFLRAPYGNWRQKQPGTEQDSDTSIVADLLNRSGKFPHYIGPVNWDISAADYDYWKRCAPAEECAAAYYETIGRVGRGIVLLHDSSEDPEIQAHNRTFQTTQLLVPALKAAGYRFVSLDAIPQVRSAVARWEQKERACCPKKPG